MVVVTGAAGFIGSRIVAALRARGHAPLLVDHADAPGWRDHPHPGLERLTPSELVSRLGEPAFCAGLEGVLHQGACADTLERDPAWMMDNNVVFPARLLEACITHEVPLVYASSAAVYGASERFEEEPANERPLNLYGVSKLAFDLHVRNELARARATVAGLRYFNVYGVGEAHKGPMASMVHQMNQRVVAGQPVQLFGASHGFGPGEQRRDFVWVDDVVAVNLALLFGTPRQGIFNVGTGTSRSFNEVFETLRALHGRGELAYRPFPPDLLGCYQAETRADLGALRGAGIDHRFASLEDGIRQAFSH